ncbi:MAG: alpha/beta fold hydrolase [Burkholderiales bacterium]|nr:alpha/beta fold hydrolase [Burkholderiales bacterium]
MARFSRFTSMLHSGFCGSNIQDAPAAGITALELLRPEGRRRYLIAAPSRAPSGLRPLVIVLHGGGASAAQVLGQEFPPSPLSVWLEIAEREQLVVIAPQGRRNGWNDSFPKRIAKPNSDDCGFISAIIAKSIAEHAVDPARVYVIGVSRGGMLAYRLASELAPQLAAFCTVLAPMPRDSICAAPTIPLSALIVAATADPLIPYAGGKFFFPPLLSAMQSMEESVAVWRNLAGLTMEASVIRLPHRHSNDPTRLSRLVWGADPQQLQVALLKIEHGGHAEPSLRKRYPWLLTRLSGAQNADVEIAEEAWAFFKDKRAGLQPN